MEESNLWRNVMSLVYGAQSFTAIALDVVLLVLVVSVVRRHRPDVYDRFLAWSVTSLAWGIISPILRTIAPLASRDGLESFYRIQSVLGVVGLFVHIAIVILLARSLVAIAQPPKSVTTEPVGPYR